VPLVSAWWEKSPHARRCLPFEVASCSEVKMQSLVEKNSSSTLLNYHSRQLTRVFPHGTRFGSSNIPVNSFLSIAKSGAQIICLNYQTNDSGQQLNRSLFRLNGGCGYVLKQPLLTTKHVPYTPHPTAFSTNSFGRSASLQRKLEESMEAFPRARLIGAPHNLELQVVCGHHLSKPGEERIAPEVWDHFDPLGLLPAQHRSPSLAGASNVYCVIEGWHQSSNPAEETSLRHETKTVSGNGLNPYWGETVKWSLPRPNMAFIKLTVYNRGVLKDDVIGTDVLPVMALRQGYRSVALRTQKGLRLQLAALLVHIRLEERIGESSAEL